VPFGAGLLLAGQLRWEALPAAVALLGLFLIREPLVVLWRQARIWKEPHAETSTARRTLAVCLPAVLLSSLVLLWRLPFVPLAALGAMGGLLLGASFCLTIQNRQRSILLQLASASGLNASALLAWLAVRPVWSHEVWWLWGLLAAQSFSSILLVHAWLEARITARLEIAVRPMRRASMVAESAVMVLAALLLLVSRFLAAGAMILSALVHVTDLARLGNPSALETPLRRIGVRELVLSIVVALLTVTGLRS